MTLEAIRARHVEQTMEYVVGPNEPYCPACEGQVWPCDTAQVLALLDDMRNAMDMTSTAYREILGESLAFMAERDASREREKALAEALRYRGVGMSRLKRAADRQAVVNAALAAHEEAQK